MEEALDLSFDRLLMMMMMIWKCLLSFGQNTPRGVFTVMIMKLKLPGPSITRAPSKALGGAPTISSKCPEILHIYMTATSGFPKFDNSSKNLHNTNNNQKMTERFLHSQKQKPNFDHHATGRNELFVLFSP